MKSCTIRKERKLRGTKKLILLTKKKRKRQEKKKKKQKKKTLTAFLYKASYDVSVDE